MAGGERPSQVVRALQAAEKRTRAEIRVHFSRHWLEGDPFARAQRLFREFAMNKTADRSAVLLYLNLRRRRFAFVADEGALRALGQPYFEGLARDLHEDLHSTYYENAVALAVRTLGYSLARAFPKEM